jgi:dienelactone hydrolase
MIKTSDVEYRDGDLVCQGFLAYDDAVAGKRPGVLVVHEAWGLHTHAMERAKMIAGLGYVGFAADMYGGRRHTTNREEMMGIMGDIRQNPPKLRGRAKAALNTLIAQPQVDTTRLGGIGFCFGGTTVLELARDGTNLAGVVSFHGNLTTLAPAQPGKVKASILVCHGADDPLVPHEQLVGFENEMRAAGADWQLLSYGGTVHSFTNPAADGTGIPGTLYNKRTDERSWAAMQAFFSEVFARRAA